MSQAPKDSEELLDNDELPSLDTVDGQEALAMMFGVNGGKEASEQVSKYSHCNLCGSHLHFSYITDFSRNVTHETAKCPECSIRIRKVMFKLQ